MLYHQNTHYLVQQRKAMFRLDPILLMFSAPPRPYPHQVQTNNGYDLGKHKEYDDLDMGVEKREVLELENRYEAKNTRMLIDVNTGEDDIVQENGDVVGAEKKKLRRKIDHVQETIDILKQRKIEMNRKNEFLNAPKQAEAQKKKQDQNKD